ncbi:hypothetical protein ABZ746_23620 [Streptomyces sp. NPDC020096]
MEDVDVIAAGLRAKAFPDRWSACTTWATGLLSWHHCARMDIWSPSVGYDSEWAPWIHALIACALHQAAGDDDPSLLSTSLVRTAQLLVDAPTAVATVDSLPQALPRGLACYLAPVARQLQHANLETTERMLHIIGLAHQVLADHAAHGEILDDRIPALARASRMGMALTDDTYRHPAYPGAPSMSQHLSLIRELREMQALADLSGQHLPPADRRAFLLHAAAFADRWLLAWDPNDQPTERVESVQALASGLLQHDQEHSASSSLPDFDAGLDDLRAYVRHQFALWLSSPQTSHGCSAD